MRKIILNTLTIAFLFFASPLIGNGLIHIGQTAAAAEFSKDPIPLKNAKHYDEANDPAFRRCGTNSQGPQHGYFAVPLLILGLGGVLLYFSKNE